MKILLAGASALLLGGSAMAAVSTAGSDDPSSGLAQVQYAFTSVPAMISPEMGEAAVDAGVQIAMAQRTADDPSQWTGMGGPEEPAVWPACRPGPGDDRCIQLYERGVREAYAQWTGSGSETGMGGPEESELMAKNPALEPMKVDSPDGSWDDKKKVALMEHPDGGVVTTAEQMQRGSAWAQHGGMSEYSGVGGPEEDEPRLYPLCRSRSDDRCQQGS